MQKLVWQNSNGDIIDLTSGNYGITNWEGFSNADLNIQSQQVPFQDGGVFLDALIEQRELSVTLAMNDNGNLEERYRMRRELIHALNPKLGEGYLIYTNDFISKRIKCVAQIPLFPTHNSNDSGTPKASLAWTACEPYWEDVEENIVVFDITKQPIIENEGDIPTQMEIDFLTNYVENPTITRLEDNKKIKYDNILSDSLLINTNTGKKSAILEKIEFFILHIGGPINDILYEENSDKLFIVSDKGLIYISKEMQDWQIAQRVIDADLHSIIYIEELGMFVAVGGDDYSSGSIITSTDGYHWSIRKTDYNFRDVIYAKEKNLIVAVGEKCRVAVSSDGIEWQDIFISPGGSVPDLNEIIYVSEKDLFVIVSGYSNSLGYIFTSSDGENWTSHIYGNPLYSITYSKQLDLFVIVGRLIVLTSSDGENWTNVSSTGGNHIIYSEEYKIFIKIGNTTSGVINTSKDSVNWEYRFTCNNLLNCITKYISLLGMFIAGGENGIIVYSYDGIDWHYKIDSSVSGVNKNITLFSATFSKKLGIYVLVGTNGAIYTSKDLLQLKSVHYNINYTLTSVAYSETKNLFVAVGENVILTSSDGENWTSQDFSSSNAINFHSVIYVEDYGLFIAGGYFATNNNLAFRYSVDGVSWTTQLGSLSNTKIYSIAYSKDIKKFVAVGGNNAGSESRILKGEMTEYGISWQQITVSNTTSLSSIIYSENLKLFIAVGSYKNGTSQILTSENGTIWNTIETGLETIFLKCYYSESKGILFVSSRESNEFSSYTYSLYKSYDVNIFTKIQDVFVSINDYLENNGNIYGLGELCAIINDTLKLGENVINNISKDSDMGLNLQIGDNQFRLNRTNGSFNCRIKYRQKYIGV